MDRVTRQLTVVALLLSTMGPAFAQGGPRETVEAADQRIRALLSKSAPAGSQAAADRQKQLKEIVNDFLDLDFMAEQALGREWSKRSDTERREYLSLMRQLVERSYLRTAEDRTSYQLQFGAVDVDAARGTAEVETTLSVLTRGRRENIEVVYTLTLRAGRWRVTDIETDGASMVRNYRAQFRRIIQEHGFSELVGRMRRRLEEGATDL